MPKTVTLQLSPKQSADEKFYIPLAARHIGIRQSDIALARIVKRSIDARQRMPKVNLTLEIYVDTEPQPQPVHFDYPSVDGRTEVIVVGSGPAGLFAALRLIESGYRPIVLERGKSVLPRKHDIAQINRNGAIDPDSNYAFGEGGALCDITGFTLPNAVTWVLVAISAICTLGSLFGYIPGFVRQIKEKKEEK